MEAVSPPPQTCQGKALGIRAQWHSRGSWLELLGIFLTGMEFQLFQNKWLFCFLHVPVRLVIGPAVMVPVGLLSVLFISFGRFVFCILFMDG